MSLALDNVTYQIGSATLLANAHMSIEPGKLTVIAGPNGAGKSTALKLLSGDLMPSHGQANLSGQALTNFTAKQLAQQRAVMPQSARPAFGLKVWELVQTGRAPFGESDGIAQKHTHAALERVAALDLAGRDVATLSGGERQRVFLAKALCQVLGQSESYLLLDEPTSALDLKQSQRVLRILRQAADDGLGVCVILHDLAASRRYGDVVYLLSEGRVHSHGDAYNTLTPRIISDAYDVDVDIADDAVGGRPLAFAAE